MARLHVRVQPKASTNEVLGFMENGTLRIRVTAPPENSKANTAIIKLLAEYLSLPPSAVEIVRGQRSRNKTLEIAGITDAELRPKLGEGSRA